MRKTLFQKLSFSVLLLGLFSWSGNIYAQGGQTCATAALVTGPGTYNATGATAGAGASATSCDPNSTGVATNAEWYSWTPATTGIANVFQCTNDTRVHIRTGVCGTLTCVAGNDDDSQPSGAGDCGGLCCGSSVSWTAMAGTEYFIEWDDRWTGGTTPYTWDLTQLLCAAPAGTATADNSNCPTDWSINVDVTDLGSGASVDISYTVNAGTPVVVAGVGLGITSIGPFADGDNVNVDLLHESDTDCDVNLVTGLINSCPVIIPVNSSIPYCEDFEATSGLSTSSCVTAAACATCFDPVFWTQSTTDDGNWNVDVGGTGSTGTGLTTDFVPGTTAGRYIYLEGTGCAPGSVNELISPLFDISTMTSTNGYRVSWAYAMLGAAMGTLEVLVSEDAGPYTSIWSASGDQGAAWLTAEVDRPLVGTVQFIVRGIAGTSFTTDMQWDFFCLNESPVCTAPVATASTAGACGGTTYDVIVDVTSLGDAPNVDITNDVGLPTITAVGIGMHTISGVLSGQTVNVGVVHNGDPACNISLGSFNVVVPISVVAPYTQNFDTWPLSNCGSNVANVVPDGWNNTGALNWQTCPGPTTSTGGPATDVSGTGNFMFCESSNGSTVGNSPPRLLESPCIDVSALTLPQISFYYNMNGTSFGASVPQTDSVSVLVEDPALSGNWTVVYTKLGENLGDVWNFVTFPYATASSEIRVRLHGTTDDACCSSDLAIDAFSINEAPTCVAGSLGTATVNAAGDCSTFTVDVEITSFGSAASLELSSDLLGSEIVVPVQATPVVITMGPYVVANPFQAVTITATPDDDPVFCSIADITVNTDCPCDPLYSRSPNLPISSLNDTLRDTLVIASGGQSVIDMDIIIDLTHTFVGDLDVFLISPSGKRVRVINDQCGGDDDMTVWFDDEAAGPVVCDPGTGPLVGTFQPTGTFTPPSSNWGLSLDFFDGELADGDWILHIEDDAGGDDGVLLNWCLVPTLVSCAQPDGTLSEVNVDCTGAGTYDLEVNISTLGDATTVTIETDLDGVISTESAIGTYPIGTYPLGTSVVVTLRNDQFPACDNTLSAFAFDCTPTDFCGVYTSAPGTPIPSGTVITDVISTGPLAGEVVQDLDVVLEINHTWVGDMNSITLTSPTGTDVVLQAGLCGNFDNMEIKYDDEAAATPVCASPIVGTYTPANPLSGFDAELFEGDWTLTIDNGIDAGTLVSWCLVPTLAIPDCPNPSAITTQVTDNSVTLNWTPGVGNTDYTIEWGPAGFVLGTGTVVGPTPLPGPAVIGGLAGGTTYDFYIIEDCPAGQSLNIGPATASTLVLVSTFPYCEDFETWVPSGTGCTSTNTPPVASGWSQDPTADHDWLPDVGGTGSGNTGPGGDNTTGLNGPGNYVYLETSVPCDVVGSSAGLISPAFDISGFTFDGQLEFAWHMYGATIGTLTVEIEDPAGSNNWSTAFTRSGAFQTDELDPYETEIVPLSLTGGGTFRARFTGTANGGFTGDMALDDICVSEAPCNYPTIAFSAVNCDYVLGTFDLQVEVTDMGSSITLDVDTTDLTLALTGTALTGIVAPGIYPVATGLPLNCGTLGYSMDIYDPGNPTCVITRAPISCGPENNDCNDEDPSLVMLSAGGSNTFTGCVTGSTMDPQYPFGVQGLVWTSFTTTECTDLTIDWCGTVPAWGNGSLNLYSGCDAALTVNSQNFETTTCGDGNFSIFWTSLPPGEYYYPVFWDPANNADGAYSMNVTAAAPVDPCSPNTCDEAEPIACGQVVTGSTLNNTATQGPSTCLPNHVTPGNDAWYVFENLVPDNSSFAGDGSTTAFDLNTPFTSIYDVTLDEVNALNALGDGVVTTYDLGVGSTITSVMVNAVAQVEGTPAAYDLEVDLLTDNFGGETSWDLVETGGPTTIASGTGYGNATNYIIPILGVGNGNYDFTIYDSFGDGICCTYGPGSYALNNVTTSATIASGGVFGASETTNFSVALAPADYYVTVGTGPGGVDQVHFITPPGVGLSVDISYSALVTLADPADYTVCAGCGAGGVDQLQLTAAPGVGETLYAFYGAAGGDQLVTASTCVGTTYNSMITVYEGTCGGLVCVTGNDDNCGGTQQSEVNFIATGGATYYIAVHGPLGFVGATGDYTLALTCAAPCTPPVNDECPGAIGLTPVLADGSGTTTGYTNECAFADANPSCDVVGIGAGRAQGVWFSFASGINDFMFLTLHDNDEDAAYTSTELSFALYSWDGADCATLVEEQCAVAGEGTTQLNVTPGTEYMVLVHNEGGVGIEGTFGVLLEFPPQNDAGITLIVTPDGTGCSSAIEPVVELTNFGAQDLTSVNINTSVDFLPDGVFAWTGNLAFGASELVTLPITTVVPGPPHFYDANTTMPNGVADEVPANDAALTTIFDANGEEVEVRILTDNFGGETSWEIYDAFNFLVASGSGYASNTQISEFHCLPTTFGQCFSFIIYDSFGDGICCGFGIGNWELRDTFGRTIMLDDGNFGDQSPNIGANWLAHDFCLPLSPTTFKPGECGVFTNGLLNKVWCEPVVGAPIYQFEFSDPDGDGHSTGVSFRRRIQTPTPWVRFDQMQSNPLEYGVSYMARVRADEGGDGTFNDHFSDACNMGLDAGGPPCAQLVDDLGSSTHSCGVTRFLDQGEKLWAQPVPGATDYQFRFVNLGEGYTRNINPAGTYVLIMNTWGTNPLTPGITYDVTVQSFANGSWSGFCGAVCPVTIGIPSTAQNRDITTNDAEIMLWPNPVRDETVTLSVTELAESMQDVTIDIYDMFGKVVYQQHLNNEGDELNTIIDFNDMSTGIYMVNITINDVTYVERLVVE